LEPWKCTGKGQRKREQARRPRWRVEGGDDDLVDMLHRQASISEIEATPTVLSQDKLQRRIAALESMHALKTQTAGPSPAKRHRAGPERKDLLFSTLDFWEELRAAVMARQHARLARAPRPSSASSSTPRLGNRARSGHFFAAPTAAQLEEERARVARARDALPKLIKEVKCLKFAPGLGVCAALRKVTRLLEKIDGACDAAFPTVHSTGRLHCGKEGDCKAYSYYASSGKRHYGDGGWNGVRSVAVFEPETVSGSVEDKSTFVSRVEALRCWQAAALLSVPLLARFRREVEDVRWQQFDLGGLLHRTQVTLVMKALLTELLPGIVAVWGLYHTLSPRLLPTCDTGPTWSRDTRPDCDNATTSCSSAAWLNLSTLRAAAACSGGGKYLQHLHAMNLPALYKGDNDINVSNVSNVSHGSNPAPASTRDEEGRGGMRGGMAQAAEGVEAETDKWAETEMLLKEVLAVRGGRENFWTEVWGRSLARGGRKFSEKSPPPRGGGGWETEMVCG